MYLCLLFFFFQLSDISVPSSVLGFTSIYLIYLPLPVANIVKFRQNMQEDRSKYEARVSCSTKNLDFTVIHIQIVFASVEKYRNGVTKQMNSMAPVSRSLLFGT